ncbi:hypothetical protein [Streptomyces blastmyceticus]|uniref:Adenylyltransferase AadA C-terminal domain-containing protein n=1 Tax=Streptomyces blastmyceticus TaxID=68180 RepID=A0ABP3GG97_9ACTN
MDEKLFLRNQGWPDLDPTGRPFDADAVYDIVAAVAIPEDDSLGSRGYRYEEAVTRALVDRFGLWVVGWHDSTHDGGPVAAWCCPSDSVTTGEETTDRVVEALGEWRGWLEELAEKFALLSPAPGALPEDRRWAWERAVARLVTLVLDRTSCEAGWYRHCQLVLRWYLERNGVESARAEKWVEDAIAGRFESWHEPRLPVINDVAEQIADRA